MKRIPVLIALLTLSATSCDGEEYTFMMAKRIRQALGDDLKGYLFYSYPTDNFGIGSTYRLRKKTDKPDDNTFQCATDKCLGAKSLSDPKLDAFISKGGGGAITIKETDQKAIVAGLALPLIKQVVGVDAGTKVSSKTTISLQFGKATKRKLERDPFGKFLGPTGGASASLKDAFRLGELAVVVADVVVDRLDITICVDKASDSKLDASLKGKVGQVVGGEAGVKMSVTTGADGCYSLAASNPLVVAILTKTQPAGGQLGDGDLATTWADAPAVTPKKAPEWWAKVIN